MKEHPYHGIKIAFTTMHEKEKILSPLFNAKLSASFVIPKNINTDLLGTFTGEIKRDSDLQAVLRKKAHAGMKELGLDYGLASEGSFVAHPLVPFLNYSFESLVFVDAQKKIEIFSNLKSSESQALYSEIKSQKDLQTFLKQINFKEQALVLKPSHDFSGSNEFIFKGLTEENSTLEAYNKIRSQFNQENAWVETDNRAHMSFKRRAAILKSGEELMTKILSVCNGCGCPGFAMSDSVKGLPCGLCGLKSDITLKEIWTCPNSSCSHSETRPRADGLETIESSHCQGCNP